MIQAIPFPDISPHLFAFNIGGFEFALRWYALAYIGGILIARWMILRILSVPSLWPQNTPPMSKEKFEDLLTWMILGIIVGGRLGYVVFYEPMNFLANPIEIVKVWNGGMSFHGGFIGVILAVWIFCTRHKIALGPMADIVAVAAPPGLLAGRLANFINGELWGRPTDMPWGVIFPGAHAQSCGEAVVGACARHPSQLYEAILEGVFLGALLLFLALRSGLLKKTWALTAIFFVGYGLSRFIVEFFRQPDALFQTIDNPIGYAIQFGSAGLTLGQLLTLPIIAIGVMFWMWSRKS